ncbi:MAG: iron-containing redox enzyme family protein [Myxococcales bacterium]|nr:iron-containing redox enzyme family protein [Myxococcales bacterium]
MTREQFLEALQAIMEAKQHWAWASFTDGTVIRYKLYLHFEQEYEVYIRDFPVPIGHAYVQCPDALARRELAENLYEEETGGLDAGRPHSELFLDHPRGLGFDLPRFDCVELFSAARAYRNVIDDCAQHRDGRPPQPLRRSSSRAPDTSGEVDSTSPKRLGVSGFEARVKVAFSSKCSSTSLSVKYPKSPPWRRQMEQLHEPRSTGGRTRVKETAPQ